MKFLVIGLGSMGCRRLRNLRALDAGELIGFDLQQERCDRVAGEFGIETFNDLQAALASSPDALVISTPPGLHMMYAQTAVDHDMHFFAEADTAIEGMSTVQRVAAEKNLVAAPSCTMRFHPSVRKIKELLDQGAIGRVLTFTHHCGQYLPDWHPWEDYRTFYVAQRDTGACREIVPFELVWLTWLVGNVATVSGFRGKLSDLDADIDDVSHLLMRFENGVIGHLLVDVVARAPVRAIRILGSDGTIEWTASEKAVRVYRPDTQEWVVHEEPRASVQEGYSEMSIEGMYVEEMRAFVTACCGEAPYPFTLPEDRTILEVLYASERSSDEGRHVTF